MKTIKSEMSADIKQIELLPLADFHIGDAMADWKLNHHGRKMMYSIYLTHGSGGGRKEGGKINRLADLATIVDADVYITAHTHLPATFKTGFFRTSASNSSVQYVSKLFVNTAAALDYGGYGDKQGYKPSSKDYPTIILSGTEKKATVMF